MSWIHVLDCKKYWGSLDTFAAFASQSGYRFFNWNGSIYFILSSGLYEDTGLTVEDVK